MSDDYLKDEANRMERETAEGIDREVERGQRLARQLAMHMMAMGGADETSWSFEYAGRKWQVEIKCTGSVGD